MPSRAPPNARPKARAPAHLLPAFVLPASAEAVSTDVDPQAGQVRRMLGQVSWAASAGDLKALLQWMAGVEVLSAWNKKPKGFRGRKNGGMWNIVIAAADDAKLQACHGLFRFVSSTTVRKYHTEAAARAANGTLDVKPMQVEIPTGELPDFLRRNASAAPAPASAPG